MPTTRSTLPSRGLALLLGAAATLAGAVAPAAETTPLRIVTFNAEILIAPRVRPGNLQKYRFDHARNGHLERVANVIEVLTPDVLNLVEVTSVEAVDRLVEILHEKGHTDYRGYHVESNDTFSGMDVGVISRVPLVRFDPPPPPPAPDANDEDDDYYRRDTPPPSSRGGAADESGQVAIATYYSDRDDPTWRQAFDLVNFNGQPGRSTTSLSRNAVYFIDVAGWKLGFLGLHLKSNPSDDNYANPKRTAEVEVARRLIRGEILSKGYLPLVLGDLNDYDPDVPDRDDSRSTVTEAIGRLKDYDPDRDGDELVNAAEWIPRKADRYTSHWDWNENGAEDGEDVFTMIDHILLPKELAPYVTRTFIAHTVGLETSDHFPVVVDLELPPAP